MFQQCNKHGVEFYNEFFVLDLIMVDGVCCGIIAYEIGTGDLHVFHAKSVLFATGGYGKMFKITSNAHTLTGDGPGVVYRKGLPLEDMEFFQFHPTGLYGLGILLSEAARGEGGILRNADGERFMERYAPTIKDLAPRDMVSRAEFFEIKEGRGAGPKKDYILLDLTHLDPEVIETKLPDITEFARTYLNVDPLKEGVPIVPTAHYAMGGIPTNVEAAVRSEQPATSSPASTQPASARAYRCTEPTDSARTRCSTSSSSDAAGASTWPSTRTPTSSRRSPTMSTRRPSSGSQGLMEGDGSESPAHIREKLQEEMMDKASVVRTEDSLKRVQYEITGPASPLRDEPGSRTAARSSTPSSSSTSSSGSCSTWPKRWSSRLVPGPRAAAVTTARITRCARTTTG